MPSSVDESLLCRVPLLAKRLLYIGDDAAAFEAAARARNPDLQVSTAPEGPDDVFDCCMCSRTVLNDLPTLTSSLKPGGTLVAALPALDADGIQTLLSVLPKAGIGWVSVRPMGTETPFDDLAPDLNAALRAGQACPPMIVMGGKGGASPQLLALRIVAYAPRLMDIRTVSPAQSLRSTGDVAVVYSHTPATLPSVPANQPRVLILQRPSVPEPADWRDNLVKILRRGWVSVVEFDDHPALAAQYLKRPPEWHLFSGAHAIQTSTAPLGVAFREVNPEVRVFPNAAFELPPFREGPRPRRIFFGAFRRGQYGIDLMRSLRDIPREFPDAEFVVVGDREIFEAAPGARKTFHEPMPYADYLKVMSTCSISLAPMEPFPMAETKSDTKFVDASARGMLTIASPTIYAESIVHGRTGLLAEHIADWAPLLASVLRNDLRREEMARAAWEYVRDRRMFRHQIADRLAWYRSLWARREALTQGLLERTPGLAAALAEKA